ncbi:E3 UFM1-protein ligase 1 homolog [Daktulosphaira vitifoliae]|uniref:E3 UFM1-protein ligase 1 homolog n=1 Tax=Daktulosphaira vitifoliae TaxID=58002 RepID=UPI0021AAC6FA|nr:E3 UFM1-protein ligase 1 homolog [Daktulosphaira vitifoliae]XP_050535663.1 E3 UFM1-protein ligase 1 homolog [Daktulosphaira vitifoliae]
MTSSDWNEVKLLAADFQRIQLTSSSQRLGERNCIEIVSKLISSKQLDVVFTTDGKEYITPIHLTKELQDETYVQGGRINILDAARSLKVDSVIAIKLCEKLAQKEPDDFFVIHGQLIGSNYLNEIAEDIIDKLEQYGHINSIKISQQYDLPVDLIDMILHKHTKKLSFNIHRNKNNPYLYYTDLYFNSIKRIVKGAVLAVTRPILCTAIINQCSIDEKEFFSVLESLLASKQVPGILTDRIGNACTYIPNIHVKTLNDWVLNFYSNNNYLDYAAMNSVGITDPSSFISRMSIGKEMITLTSCSVGPKIIDDVSSAIEDSIVNSSWIDIMDVVPMVFDTKDGVTILEYLLKKKKLSNGYQIFDKTVLVTDKFIEKQINSILNTLEGKIKQKVESGDYANALLEWKVQQKITEDKNPELSRKEERKKKSGGKHGGGTQGRETKIKAVKKKYGQKTKQQDSDSDDNDNKIISNEQYIIEIVTLDEIKQYLMAEETFKDIEGEKDSLIEKIALHFYPILNKEMLRQAQIMHDQIMANRTGDRRKVHQEFRDKILLLITDFHHYIKGIQKLDNSDVQSQLTIFLLKLTGGDIIEVVQKYIKENREHNSKLKSIQYDDNQIQNAVERLQKSLVTKSTDDFNESVDLLLSAVDIVQKKNDRKKEREYLQNNRQLLLESLSHAEEDAAQVLLISTQLLFQSITSTMIKISGKFVSSILAYLQKHLNENDFNLLQKYHDLVVQSLKTENYDDREIIELQLKELTSTVKDFVINYKKSKSEH